MKIPRYIKDGYDPEFIFDTVIIGGGITGLATAREAALRGLKTIVIEKKDFGWSTSAATSKMLHGGLRYLENYEFSLVRESLRERRIMGLMASHLVRPLPFIFPVYRNTKPNALLMGLGLSFYDLLAFDKNKGVPHENKVTSSVRLSRREVLDLEPSVPSENLKSGFLFYDYQSLYPERLSLAFLKSAVQSGARCSNYTEVTGFKKDSRGMVCAVTVRDVLSSQEFTVKGRTFINAAGPWTDSVLELLTGNPESAVQRSQGIHILTRSLFQKRAVFFRHPSGRHFFVNPWMGYSLIGPTDTPFPGHPDSLKPENPDIQQLLSDVNDMIPDAHLTFNDIYNIIIGIRPLVSSGRRGGGTYRTSRRHEITDHKNGVITVAGGKWTTSRGLGEEVIKKLLKTQPMRNRSIPDADSSKTVLFGAPPLHSSPAAFLKQELEVYPQLVLDDSIRKNLILLYGSEHREILDIVLHNRDAGARLQDYSPEDAEAGLIQEHDIIAQVIFAVKSESACTLEDILCRRMSIGTRKRPSLSALEKAAAAAGSLLGWSAAGQRSQIDQVLRRFP